MRRLTRRRLQRSSAPRIYSLSSASSSSGLILAAVLVILVAMRAMISEGIPSRLGVGLRGKVGSWVMAKFVRFVVGVSDVVVPKELLSVLYNAVWGAVGRTTKANKAV